MTPFEQHPSAPASLRALLLEALSLKALPRAGWIRAGVPAPESVAAHSWGVAWLVLALCPPHLNLGHALALATIHDIPEIYAGDITPHDPISLADKHTREASALHALLSSMSDRIRAQRLFTLWQEYDAASSPEAAFVKACDKLDMALQAARYQAQHPSLHLDEFITSALQKLSDPDLRALANPSP